MSTLSGASHLKFNAHRSIWRGRAFWSRATANAMVYIGSNDGNLHAFGLIRGLATPVRPDQNSLHPDYNLPQRQ